jgi:hypothetical protein
MIGTKPYRKTYIQMFLLMVSIKQCLRNTLAFFIAGSRTDGVDVAPVALRLWMYLRNSGIEGHKLEVIT